MKAMCNFKPNIDVFKNTYNEFSKTCLEGKAPIAQIRGDFYQVQKLYVKHGQVQDFFDKTSQLCEEVENKGNTNLSTLLVNELSKLGKNFNLNGKPEDMLYKAINNSRRNKDGLHELARIINLEQIYKYSNNRKDKFKVLRMKKDCCKRVLADYEANAKNFLSIKKAPTTKNQVKTQLAFAYCDLADMLAQKHPDDAIALYEKSREINRELKRYRAADYAMLCIRDIQEGRYRRY